MAFLTDGTPVGYPAATTLPRMDLEGPQPPPSMGDSLTCARQCVSNEDMYFTNSGPMYVFSPETGYIGQRLRRDLVEPWAAATATETPVSCTP